MNILKTTGLCTLDGELYVCELCLRKGGGRTAAVLSRGGMLMVSTSHVTTVVATDCMQGLALSKTPDFSEVE